MTTSSHKPEPRWAPAYAATTLGWLFLACTVFVLAKPGGWLHEGLSEWTETRGRAQLVVGEWAALGGGSLPFGDTHTPRLVEFVDYRCSFCRVVHDSIERAVGQRNAGSPMSLGIRYTVHPDDAVGRSAAIAAICAAEQGSFETLHTYLLTDTLWLSTKDWRQVAVAGGVEDVALWELCRSSRRAAAVLAADSVWSDRLRVNATPTFVTADGTVHIGVLPVSVLRRWLQSAPAQTTAFLSGSLAAGHDGLRGSGFSTPDRRSLTP